MSCFGNYQMRVRCSRLFLGIRDPVENRGVFVGINIAPWADRDSSDRLVRQNTLDWDEWKSNQIEDFPEFV